MFVGSSRTGNARVSSCLVTTLVALILCRPAWAQPQELRLNFTSANTTINFTLGDILHTIHGSFKLQQGDVEYQFRTGAVQGKLTIEAASGQTGNHSRDHKMQRDILESARYPQITFRPQQVEGTVALAGTATVVVKGIFSIHGVEHELVMPVRVEISPDHWVADTQFTIPYVKWGMKNPSTFLLRVSESVEINVHAVGTNPFPRAQP
jgi:polyisoprenoid-binding protein YceI